MASLGVEDIQHTGMLSGRVDAVSIEIADDQHWFVLRGVEFFDGLTNHS